MAELIESLLAMWTEPLDVVMRRCGFLEVMDVHLSVQQLRRLMRPFVHHVGHQLFQGLFRFAPAHSQERETTWTKLKERCIVEWCHTYSPKHLLFSKNLNEYGGDVPPALPVLNSCSLTWISAFSRRICGRLLEQSSPNRELWSRCSICRNLSLAARTTSSKWDIGYCSVTTTIKNHDVVWYGWLRRCDIATIATKPRSQANAFQRFRTYIHTTLPERRQSVTEYDQSNIVDFLSEASLTSYHVPQNSWLPFSISSEKTTAEAPLLHQIPFLLAGLAQHPPLLLQIRAVAIAAAARPSGDANLLEALIFIENSKAVRNDEENLPTGQLNWSYETGKPEFPHLCLYRPDGNIHLLCQFWLHLFSNSHLQVWQPSYWQFPKSLSNRIHWTIGPSQPSSRHTCWQLQWCHHSFLSYFGHGVECLRRSYCNSPRQKVWCQTYEQSGIKSQMALNYTAFCDQASVGTLEQVKCEVFGVEILRLQNHHWNDVGILQSLQDHVFWCLDCEREFGQPELVFWDFDKIRKC